MIRIQKNTHHINGADQPVIEIWQTDPSQDQTSNLVLIVSVPHEEDEEVQVML